MKLYTNFKNVMNMVGNNEIGSGKTLCANTKEAVIIIILICLLLQFTRS